MSLRYFDIHSHLYFPQYDEDRYEAAWRMKGAGVVTATVGTNAETSRKAIALVREIGGPAVVGLHPGDDLRKMQEDGRLSAELDEITELASDDAVRAIGECGFDFISGSEGDEKLQEEVFTRHIELAEKFKKPLMLHLRSSKTRSAYTKALDMLENTPNLLINSHFFAGSIDEARRILERGGTVSFTGVITFAKEYEELVKFVPLDRMHAETDAPYVAPVPYRGKRNEPSYVVEVVKKIAEIKEMPLEGVQEQLLKNAERFFFTLSSKSSLDTSQ